MPQGLRLVAVPDVAPPYDDHGPDDHSPVCAAGREVIVEARPAGVPAVPEDAGSAGPPAAGERHLPGGEAGMALAVVIVEVLAGVRPERQLLPLATDRVRARVRALGPVLRGDRRPRIARVRGCQPAPGVVEMAVVVTAGPRTRALALRFEHAAARAAAPGRAARPARWLCTALETG